jgi:UDP-N-acetylglucosamine--dolichyl-phosphate N-acetylglucosaminephosphotransferase
MITFIGFIDDLLLKKNRESSFGLRQWQKPILTLVAAIPLMVVNAGSNIIKIPFFGRIDIGIYYALILVPIGVVGAANMINLLAGFNGLEAGMGLVYTGILALYAYLNNRPIGLLISLITFTVLIAFFIYNKYPAKIFPGDSLTYLLGASLACIAILGDMERAALICSIPFFIELFLKARSKFKAQTYGYYKDGKIHSRYKEIYSIPHIFTRTGKFTEKQITYFLILIELIFSNLIWFI